MNARRWRLGALLAVMATGLVGMAGTAGAHGPEATFTPIGQEPAAGALAAELRVTLLYDDDADPVDDATVQVTPVDGSGAEGAPATLERTPEPGTYEGAVAVPAPGDWTFKLRSADPEAELELPIGIPEPAPATVAPTTGTPTTKKPAVASSLPEGSLTTEADTPVVSEDTPAPSDDADDGSFPWGIAVLVAVVAAGVAMAMAYAMRPNADDEGGNGPVVTTEEEPRGGGPDDLPT